MRPHLLLPSTLTPCSSLIDHRVSVCMFAVVQDLSLCDLMHDCNEVQRRAERQPAAATLLPHDDSLSPLSSLLSLTVNTDLTLDSGRCGTKESEM